ncbi:nicotinate-nucleotide--dimethylbenzimidazole phosphoribosyltransferase [Salipiger sp. IMCC34102]|uniref:nicotinate-nucleotide--dimethylbenzimidazole phosphoribosyltransferase n=1 Tax=Salipiger sp. IMCC34102 TaxID=2510647 RepID=UPI00101C4C0F|nr:nicotinate-nucleotide--dimethylbenzimidazole phosphoribosyltransferase [Salipiger sp. IMCC34102]RYH01801.1 nicotinate-nucleotide--dimethylbenzimidazole phosphoribosyltransferase [Salipiger sp. IMCC34102]
MAAPFDTLDTFRSLLAGAPAPDAEARAQAAERNGQLTKPPGALGRLEELALWVAGWQGAARPRIAAPQIIVFAGNHGVCAQGVSLFPAEVTAQMVGNFESGGAAINQLAKAAGARLDVVPLDLDTPTQDFTQGPAMTEAEVVAALATGWEAVAEDADLLVVGEMGIGNTTAAAAICAALAGGTGSDWAGRGTGVDDAGLSRKAAAVDAGLARNAEALSDPLHVLRCLGGREIAAMAGAIARARVDRIPVILDGFICTAAAAPLAHAVPGALDHTVAGHLSSEGAHARLLAALDKRPILDLRLRLGEGSGAAVAIPVLRAAVACLSDMATFAEASVAGQTGP